MDSQNPDSQLKGITGGKTKFIVLAIVIVVIVAGLGIYLASSSSSVNKKEITVLVGSGSYTCEYITQVAKNFENTHPGYTVKITTAGYSSLLTSEETALKGKSSSPSNNYVLCLSSSSSFPIIVQSANQWH
jgi:ABC-type glycerol-3-phosphate transport system substrate-binding protein